MFKELKFVKLNNRLNKNKYKKIMNKLVIKLHKNVPSNGENKLLTSQPFLI